LLDLVDDESRHEQRSTEPPLVLGIEHSPVDERRRLDEQGSTIARGITRPAHPSRPVDRARRTSWAPSRLFYFQVQS